MADKYVINDTTLTAIAEPLRDISGRTGELTPAEMASVGADAAAEVTEQADLITQIQSALVGKASGSGGGITPIGTKRISENGTHDVTAFAYAEVDVPIPDGYIVPNGVVIIDENGQHDISTYQYANVNIPIPEGYIVPSGTKEVTENGEHDVTQFAKVLVSVPSKEPVLEDLLVEENGRYTPPEGVDGFKLVDVVVEPPDPYLVDLTITENGTYSPMQYHADGFGQIVVNVPTGGGGSEPDPRDLYQRVEYIESDGSAYLVTDFVADDNTCGIEAVIAVGNYNSTATMGSREDSGNTRFYLPYPLGATLVYYGFNSAPKVTATVSQGSLFRWQTNFLNSRLAGVYTSDGASVGSSAITENFTPHTVPVAIFGLYSGVDSGVESAKNMKLYSARCSKGFDVVREYIPCYRKSDGVAGVYEKFTGAFLTPPTGLAFTYGEAIDWEV